MNVKKDFPEMVNWTLNILYNILYGTNKFGKD